MYPVIDWHCDALMKLSLDSSLDFKDNDKMDVTATSLRKGGVKVQAFAIFIDPNIPVELKYDACLLQIEMFKTKVLTQPGFKQIRSFKEIELLEESEIGAFLTLEGLDCIGSDMNKVLHVLDEGVLSIGFTWNNANLACDGIGEPRGAGLTQFGFDVLNTLNERNLFADVSHISERGFEDILDHGKHVISSHSNARSVMAHRRNLTDHQLSRMLAHSAPMHLVYLDAFITENTPATIPDILKHIDYLIDKGLTDHLGLGSDFDGINTKVRDLETSADTQNLLQHIEKKYGAAFAQKIASENFLNYVRKHM